MTLSTASYSWSTKLRDRYFIRISFVFKIKTMAGWNPDPSILRNRKNKLSSISNGQFKCQDVRKLIQSIQYLILRAFWSSDWNFRFLYRFNFNRYMGPSSFSEDPNYKSSRSEIYSGWRIEGFIRAFLLFVIKIVLLIEMNWRLLSE